MSNVKLIAGGSLIFALVTALLWGRIASEQRDSARQQLAAVVAQSDARQKVIDDMQVRVASLTAQQIENGVRQAEIQRVASNAKAKARAITYEAPVKDWADQPLPAAVVSMYEHPAVTGTGDYRQFLRDPNAVQSASDQAVDEPRPARPTR